MNTPVTIITTGRVRKQLSENIISKILEKAVRKRQLFSSIYMLYGTYFI